MKGQIDCKFFTEHLDGYLDSELDQETRQLMHRHAANCPPCAERLESMTRLLTMCAELDEGLAVPLEVQAAWRKAIREEAASRSKGRADKGKAKGARIRRWAGGIAAALILLVGGTFAYRLGGEAPPSPQPQMRSTVSKAAGADYYSGTQLLGAANPAGVRTESDGEVDEALDAQLDAGTSAGLADQGSNAQVVLRTAERTLQSSGFDQSLRSIEDLVGEYEGYFEQSTVNGQSFDEGGEGRTADLVARVPTQSLDEFLAMLDGLGTLTYRSESAEDISDRYYDVETRLNSYRVQLNRLNQLMGTASVEDMLMLEDKRTEVQLEIDSLEGQLKNWSGRAQRSTVYITLQEVEERGQVRPIGDSLGERVKTAFYDSVNWLGGFLQDAAVVLAMASPVLVIAIALVIVICVIVSAVRRGKRRRNK